MILLDAATWCISPIFLVSRWEVGNGVLMNYRFDSKFKKWGIFSQFSFVLFVLTPIIALLCYKMWHLSLLYGFSFARPALRGSLFPPAHLACHQGVGATSGWLCLQLSNVNVKKEKTGVFSMRFCFKITIPPKSHLSQKSQHANLL